MEKVNMTTEANIGLKNGEKNMKTKKNAKKKIREVEKKFRSLPATPQSFTYIRLCQVLQEMHFQGEYGLVCEICDVLLEMTNCENEQKAIKEVLKHFDINKGDLPSGGFAEFRNNNCNCGSYGIERIMEGRRDRKVRIIIDYDVDFPKAILRVFPNDDPLAVLEEKEMHCPNR